VHRDKTRERLVIHRGGCFRRIYMQLAACNALVVTLPCCATARTLVLQQASAIDAYI
jgi:hypothetical protein